VLTDIANGQLASVSWVIPSGQASDHPGISDGSGPSWVASVVNAIGNSQYWSNTAIIITWDDWGGWHDHVSPTLTGGPGIINSYEYGFPRAPDRGLALREASVHFPPGKRCRLHSEIH
jgi:phospholipase C